MAPAALGSSARIVVSTPKQRTPLPSEPPNRNGHAPRSFTPINKNQKLIASEEISKTPQEKVALESERISKGKKRKRASAEPEFGIPLEATPEEWLTCLESVFDLKRDVFNRQKGRPGFAQDPEKINNFNGKPSWKALIWRLINSSPDYHLTLRQIQNLVIAWCPRLNTKAANHTCRHALTSCSEFIQKRGVSYWYIATEQEYHESEAYNKRCNKAANKHQRPKREASQISKTITPDSSMNDTSFLRTDEAADFSSSPVIGISVDNKVKNDASTAVEGAENLVGNPVIGTFFDRQGKKISYTKRDEEAASTLMLITQKPVVFNQ